MLYLVWVVVRPVLVELFPLESSAQASGKAPDVWQKGGLGFLSSSGIFLSNQPSELLAWEAWRLGGVSNKGRRKR